MVMKLLFPIVLSLSLLCVGCAPNDAEPQSLAPLTLVPDVEAILHQTARQREAVDEVRGIARSASAEAATAVAAPLDVVDDAAGEIDVAAQRIGDKEPIVAGLQDDLRVARAELADTTNDLTRKARSARDWAFGVFLIAGGVGLVGAAVVFFIGNHKTALILGAGALAAIIVGLVLPALIAITELLILIARIGIIAIAVGAAGVATYVVIRNRRELLERLRELLRGAVPIVKGVDAAKETDAKAAKTVTVEIAKAAEAAGAETTVRNLVDAARAQ